MKEETSKRLTPEQQAELTSLAPLSDAAVDNSDAPELLDYAGAERRLPKYLTLHRYFLQASRNRSLFLAELQDGDIEGPRARLHLELWYACLVPVLEGWVKERINNPPVTAFMRENRKMRLLRQCRNAVFHYSPQYLDERTEELFSEVGMVEWVHGLHGAISAFFLAEDA
jgi:hypothetical protein